jgi:hypothetical protein
MPCSLTQGYAYDCKNNVGGIKKVLIASRDDIDTITIASGLVSNITFTSNDFYLYDLVRESSNFNETVNTNVQNGTVFYAQTLEIVLNKLQVNTRNEIILLGQNRLCICVEDNNGKWWMLGFKNGLDLTGGGSASGTGYGDRNGYTLTFTGSENELAPEVDAAALSAWL